MALRNSSAVGPTLVITGLAFQEAGAALAVTLFPSVGAIGLVALRLVVSAALLWLIARPELRGHTAQSWRTVVYFGVALAAMNAFFYLALERLPLGVTVTIEVLGPLALSVIAGRRWVDALWAVIALAGVVLLGGGGADLDPLGVFLALCTAACWATYIIFSAKTGAAFSGLHGLTLAMTVGGVLMIPFAVADAGAALFSPRHSRARCGCRSPVVPHPVCARAHRAAADDSIRVLDSARPRARGGHARGPRAARPGRLVGAGVRHRPGRGCEHGGRGFRRTPPAGAGRDDPAAHRQHRGRLTSPRIARG